MRRLLLCLLASLLFTSAVSRELPGHVRRSIDSMLDEGLKEGYYPGASIVVGGRGGIMYERCVGFVDDKHSAQVTPDHLYDLASLTKVVATTFAVMKLYDLHRIDLNKRVGDYVEYYDGSEVARIPLSQLLTHTSGLPFFAIFPMVFTNPDGGKLTHNKYDEKLYPLHVDNNCFLCPSPEPDPLYVSLSYVPEWRRAGENVYVNPATDTLITNKIVSSYREDLRGKYRYSDTNFHILRQIVEAITGEPLDDYTRTLYDELGMDKTGYRPMEWSPEEYIVPTEVDHLMQRGLIRGYPHDEFAAVSDRAVNGHAGLFSRGRDLALFCEMMLGEGSFRGRRIISRQTVALFTSSPLVPQKIFRGLGFDKRDPDSTLGGGYGHTGYTGTMFWIDEQRDLYMIFLSNRVNPTRLNTGLSDSSLRTKMWSVLKGM